MHVRAQVVVLDLPMTVRPRRMLSDRFPVEYEPTAGGRIGLHPRRGGGDARWFDVEPCVVLHTVNAHESNDGQTLTLTALRSKPSGDASFIEAYTCAARHSTRTAARRSGHTHMHTCTWPTAHARARADDCPC